MTAAMDPAAQSVFDFCIVYDVHEGHDGMFKMIYSTEFEDEEAVGIALSADGRRWETAGMIPGYGDTVPCIYRHNETHYDAITRQQWYTPRYFREVRGTTIMRGTLKPKKRKLVWTTIASAAGKRRKRDPFTVGPTLTGTETGSGTAGAAAVFGGGPVRACRAGTRPQMRGLK